uniref:Glutathione S-transferase theta-1-like n=1 Tax=Saccoglossus kowalevskii TaxID=10224 RepID=A0ABM0MQS0_SACKO|nr:PREDICTED: glutathione S-transferase theta-1-like [Saccoglossus kowalevskii]
MTLELYIDELSPPCRSVLLFCEANVILYEKNILNIVKGRSNKVFWCLKGSTCGDTWSETFYQINPQNKVPAIKDILFCLGESVAILKYLAAKYNTVDHWYPQDLQKRARVDEYLAWHHGNTRKDVAFLYWTEVVIPIVSGTEINQQRLENAVTAFKATLDRVENTYSIFLKDQKFLCGDDITLADIMAVPEVHFSSSFYRINSV